MGFLIPKLPRQSLFVVKIWILTKVVRVSYLRLFLILSNQAFAIIAFGILLPDLNAIFEQLIRVLFWFRSLIAIETHTYVTSFF